MAGINPYITPTEAEPPKMKYRITFMPLNKVIEVDHSCGGVCACSTCHLIVRQGLESCNEPTDDELDQLEEARGLTTESRLGCQCVPNGTCDVVVEIPGWNRNVIKEGH